MMKEIYRLLSVKQSFTSLYHTMSNGVCKYFNMTQKNLLKKTVSSVFSVCCEGHPTRLQRVHTT